jgi:hypothetical protein
VQETIELYSVFVDYRDKSLIGQCGSPVKYYEEPVIESAKLVL